MFLRRFWNEAFSAPYLRTVQRGGSRDIEAIEQGMFGRTGLGRSIVAASGAAATVTTVTTDSPQNGAEAREAPKSVIMRIDPDYVPYEAEEKTSIAGNLRRVATPQCSAAPLIPPSSAIPMPSRSPSVSTLKVVQFAGKKPGEGSEKGQWA
jgi:hypothetical protein